MCWLPNQPDPRRFPRTRSGTPSLESDGGLNAQALSHPSRIELIPCSHLHEHVQSLDQNRYAATMVFNILDRLLSIDSVLDLGCGIGTWMQAALVKPEREVLGIEIEEFAPEQLLVAPQTIINATLDREIELHRRFDLVLCLETAEHVAPECAANLVSNCVRHSDVVLFSAAIPGQGGLHHVNEQPPEYWQELFDKYDYEVIDIIRPLIWCDTEIPAWYRQNMLLFVNRRACSTLEHLRREVSQTAIPLHRAHPDLFQWQSQELARRQAALEEGESQRERLQSEMAAQAGQADSESPNAALRFAELQADLIAQREYSRRAISQAWTLISRMSSEREAERARLQTVESDKRALAQQLASAERDRSDLRSSASWRVTAPLRALAELLLRIREFRTVE